MSDVRDLLEGAGHQVLERLKSRAEWTELDEAVKDRLREVAFDLGRLSMLRLAGQQVDVELAHVQAQLASWEFQAASQAQRWLDRALEEVIQGLGVFAAGVIRSGLK